MEPIKNTKLPSERALSVTKTWEKKSGIQLTMGEKISLINTITDELQDCIMEDRDNTDKFVMLSEKENGILEYYLGVLEKMKYMVGDVIMENSRKKRDALLLEMAKVVGANVVEEQIPYKSKLKHAS
jgi:hypothetical protein